MVKYDYTYALAANQGSSSKATAQYIIAHETGNANNTGSNSAKNEAIYMKGHWQSAYTHAIAGHDRVYIVGEPGYVAYGAGTVANGRSPFQIELARYSDHALAIKAYRNYVNAIREYAKKYGIPLTLDGVGNGIKSHKWVSDNIWGDHQDPYAYLSSIGISKAQFASDLKSGVGSSVQSAKSDSDGVTTSKGIVRARKDGYLVNSKGIKTKHSVKVGSAWKVFAIEKAGILIGADEYLPFNNSKIRIGKKLTDKFKSGSEWKVVSAVMLDGKAYFQLSTTEFVTGEYTA